MFKPMIDTHDDNEHEVYGARTAAFATGEEPGKDDVFPPYWVIADPAYLGDDIDDD